MPMWKATGGADGTIGFNFGVSDRRVEPGEVVELPPSVAKVLQAKGLVEQVKAEKDTKAPEPVFVDPAADENGDLF
jgi:hypothetical protein